MSHKGNRKISTFGSRATSTASVCLVLVLLGLAGLAGLVADGIGTSLRASVGFVMCLRPAATPAEIAAFRQDVEGHEGVAAAIYRSADSILAAETRAMGVAPALPPGANPYSPELEVTLAPRYANADSLRAVQAVFGQADIVESVVAQSALLEALDSSMARVRAVLIGAAAVLLLISIALIANAVSLSIYSRRFGIHTMRLVGATASFIRGPFVRAGAVNGLVAGLVAAALLWAVRAWAVSVEPQVAQSAGLSQMAALSLAVVAAGVLLCAATSYFATTRYLSRSYDELFLK